MDTSQEASLLSRSCDRLVPMDIYLAEDSIQLNMLTRGRQSAEVCAPELPFSRGLVPFQAVGGTRVARGARTRISEASLSNPLRP